MGYLVILSMWYFDEGEGMEDGLKLLFADKGAMYMINIAKVHGKVRLFALHPLS